MFEFLMPNYSKAGKGIDRDAPPKEGLALFIEIFGREWRALIKLNIICFICCIPIVTIGPAIAALTGVTMKMVKDEHVDWFSDFKESFKKNWKQALPVGIFQILVAAVLAFSFIYYYRFEGIMFGAVMFVIGAVAVWAVMAFMYMYPMLVLINLSVKNIIKNSILLPIVNIKSSIIGAAVCIGITYLGSLFYLYGIPGIFIMTFTMAFCALVSSFCAYKPIMKNIAQKTEPKPDNNADENI